MSICLDIIKSLMFSLLFGWIIDWSELIWKLDCCDDKIFCWEAFVDSFIVDAVVAVIEGNVDEDEDNGCDFGKIDDDDDDNEKSLWNIGNCCIFCRNSNNLSNLVKISSAFVINNGRIVSISLISIEFIFWMYCEDWICSSCCCSWSCCRCCCCGIINDWITFVDVVNVKFDVNASTDVNG